jgi:photosystem II stability/assembly factor-like uncharacterized protein
MKKIFTILVLLGIYTVSNAQWIPQASGFAAPSRGIFYINAVNANVVWATAYDGAGTGLTINEFTRTTDGGTTWVPGEVIGGNTYGLANISAIDGTTAWAAIYAGVGAQDDNCGVYKTTDGGATWTQQTVLQGAASFADNVHFWNATTGVCHGDVKDGYFEVYTTTDGGATWTRVPQANFSGVAVASGEGGWTGVIEMTGTSTVMFGTNKGKLYKSEDFGMTWVASQTGASAAGTTGGVNEIAFKDPMHGLVAHTNTAFTLDLFETLDGGATWAPVNETGIAFGGSLAYVPGTPNTYVSTGANTAMAGCSYSYDGGHTWTEFNGTTGIQFLATAWVDNATGWAGNFNDAVTPTTLDGMYKYGGILTEILQLDPSKGGFKIYPNPSNGLFTLTTVGAENETVEISIYNSIGTLVYQANESSSLISYNTTLDLQHLPKGVYVASVKGSKTTLQEKIIIE